MYNGIHHVSLAVNDLERSKHFFGCILGFPEIERPPFRSQGAWYGIGQTQLHLIVGNGRTLRGTTDIDDKDGHFAIRVDNMQDIIRLLKEASVPYVENLHSLTGWHQVYVTDPDGNVIEFNA